MNVVEHVIYQLRNAPMRTYPFAHFFAENVFPEDFYNQLLNELPPDSEYAPLSEHYKARLMTDAKKAPSLDVFNTAYFFQNVAEMFLPHLPEKVDVEPALQWRLVRDHEGYEITPHTDAPWKMISLLFYLPRDESQREHGTSIYVAKDRAKRCAGGPHWPRDQFELVYTAPYIPNSCFGFVKTDQAWHGVEKIEGPIDRDVLLYNVYNLKRMPKRETLANAT